MVRAGHFEPRMANVPGSIFAVNQFLQSLGEATVIPAYHFRHSMPEGVDFTYAEIQPEKLYH